MNRLLRTMILVPVVASLTACATRSMFLNASESFAEGYEAASGAMNEVLASNAPDRRAEAFAYYVIEGNDARNLHSQRVNESFVRYVCAGFGELHKEQATVKALRDYNRTIARISEPPSDDLGELLQSLRALNAPIAGIELPAETDPDAARKSCTDRVAADLAYQPLEAMAAPTIGAAAAMSLSKQLEGIEAIAEQLREALVSILKIADDAARAEALKRYILDNNDTVIDLLDTLERSGSVAAAWERRRKAALVVPFLRFRHALTQLDRERDVVDILAAAEVVDAGLEPYDRLLVAGEPRVLVRRMREAQSELFRLARGDLSPEEAWAWLSVFADSVASARAALANASNAP